MFECLSNDYELISPESVEEFVENNEDALGIISAIDNQLHEHFPDAEFSFEVSNTIPWTTETKLLLNVGVTDEVFFNGMLDHFNDIYADIEPLIADILCPVVLFPRIKNKSFDNINSNSALNLMARTAYFNNDYDGTIDLEMG